MKPPVIWHRLEDSTPVKGPTFSTTGTPVFNAAVFGNGFFKGSAVDNTLYSSGYATATYPTDNFTVEHYWVPTNNSGGFGGSSPIMWSINDGTINNNFRCFYSGTTFTVQIRVSAALKISYTFSPSFSAGDFVHIALVFQSGATATNRVKMYINGSAETPTAGTDNVWTFNSGTYTLDIGEQQNKPANLSGGEIDNFKIYDYIKTNFNDRHNERGGFDDQVMIV